MCLHLSTLVKDIGIHGITDVAWASLGIYYSVSTNKDKTSIWGALNMVSLVVFIFTMGKGVLKALSSIVYKKKVGFELGVRHVETAVTIVSSILALLVSLFDIIIRQ